MAIRSKTSSYACPQRLTQCRYAYYIHVMQFAESDDGELRYSHVFGLPAPVRLELDDAEFDCYIRHASSIL